LTVVTFVHQLQFCSKPENRQIQSYGGTKPQTYLKRNEITLTLVECILYLHQCFYGIHHIWLCVSDLILVHF